MRCVYFYERGRVKEKELGGICKHGIQNKCVESPLARPGHS
jgi:hypothetical protein